MGEFDSDLSGGSFSRYSCFRRPRIKMISKICRGNGNGVDLVRTPLGRSLILSVGGSWRSCRCRSWQSPRSFDLWYTCEVGVVLEIGLGLVLGETEIVELVEVEAGVVWKEDVLLWSWLKCGWRWLSFVGGGAQI